MRSILAQILRWPWALGTAIVLLWNRTRAGRRLLTHRYQVVSRRIPKGFDGFRIVQLTDLHGRIFGEGHQDLLRQVAAEKPDLVLVTGDMYDYVTQDPADREPVTDLFRKLAAQWPTYAILGNHEARDRQLMEILHEMHTTGVRLLRDQTAFLKRGGACIAVTGLETDEMKDMLQTEEEESLRERLDAAFARLEDCPDTFDILLGHKPELLPFYADYPADLVLSGHAHGGLLEVPFLKRRLLAPGQGFFPAYSEGVYRWKKTRMLLSTGLGGPRFRIRPEILSITLKKQM